jgi:hypothetical protein
MDVSFSGDDPQDTLELVKLLTKRIGCELEQLSRVISNTNKMLDVLVGKADREDERETIDLNS